MENKKKYFIFGIIIVVYLVLTVTFLIIKNSNDKNNEKYLIIDQYGLFMKKNNKWSTFTKKNSDYYMFKNYDIFDGQTYLGNYTLQYNDRWYLWDDNNNSIQYDDKILAYRGNEQMKLKVLENVELNSGDNEIINSALKKISVNGYSNLSKSKKYQLDLDGDNNYEYVYEISILDSFNEPDKYFSIVFIYNGKDIDIIKNSVGKEEESLQLARFSLEYNISFGSDNYNHIIIQTIYFSKPDKTKYSIYKYNKNKLDLVIENK